MADDKNLELAELTANIVAAYVTKNSVSTGDLPTLIQSVYTALGAAGSPTPAAAELPKATAAEIRKSRQPDYLTSFIDGKRYKSLKRHLGTNQMTPDDYRKRFGLPKDYPMVAEAYSAQRSALAKTLGLGRRAEAAAPPEPPAPPAKAKRAPKPKPGIKAEDETFS